VSGGDDDEDDVDEEEEEKELEEDGRGDDGDDDDGDDSGAVNSGVGRGEMIVLMIDEAAMMRSDVNDTLTSAVMILFCALVRGDRGVGGVSDDDVVCMRRVESWLMTKVSVDRVSEVST
jgi:hypothetical protein